ncbi:YveK family protein [Halobacillus amylolyticus]|uniref:Wzz/FepE/Etk N-terminal domain-containing protein n=1 Tax=Halobacillus amylolyticus TaxID=2932259 RepID=A0ABY4HG93_9BACI|nr:Wzz/FepE/Etk N-terminal domain-containing protein [Halobacillus amylolyticus]UOR13806.1 Wzz/FepE/Etk N-terminal domain-containing protein [Halobacillus amylolyticus]
MSRMKQVNFNDDGRGKEINLKEYFDVIKNRFWIIILITILTTLAGLGYNHVNNTLLYESSTRMILSTEDDNMNTLMVMIKDPIIMEEVREELQLSQSAGSLASQIEVSQLEDSQVIRISVTATDPKRAVEIANATAKVYKNEIVNILDFDQVQLLSEAKENPFPINGDQSRTVILAALFGVMTGIGLVFLLDTLDSTVKNREDVEEYLEIPVIGFVSPMNKRNSTIRKKKQRNEEVELRGESVDIK